MVNIFLIYNDRHLTDNDILVQEDLKLLIQAILNKQRRFENSKHNKALTFKSRFGKVSTFLFIIPTYNKENLINKFRIFEKD